jgi:hypothetical protein
LGYIAGVGTTISTMPLEVLATRLQSAEANGQSAMQVVRCLLAKEGIAGLFRGFWFNILLCINPAIQNTCFDYMKAVVLRLKRAADSGKRPVLTATQAFLLGAVAKAIATGFTYPLVRVKTLIQCAATSEKSAREPVSDVHPAAAADSLARPGRQGATSPTARPPACRSRCSPQMLLARLAELYQGISSALWKSVLQAALLYMTKDQVERVVSRFFWICAKTMTRLDGTLKLGAFSGRPLPA